MTMPIQVPPINRANRMLDVHVGAASRGVMPQKIDFGDLVGIGCEACNFLPFPGSLACRFICKSLAERV